MPTKTEVRQQFGDSLTPDDIYKKIAERLNPAGIDEVRSRGWRWKLDLWKRDENNKWVWNLKDKFDLYKELAKAPFGIAYDPGPTQLEAHRSPERFKQISGGWRAGKSKWMAGEILPYMFRDRAHVWIVATDYLKARPEFEYVRDWLVWLDVPITKLSDPNNGRWILETEWGARLETQTSDDPTQIEAAALDLAAVAEAGLVDYAIIRRLMGRTAEKRGDIVMSGSMDQTQQWYIDAFEVYMNGPTDDLNWHSFAIPSWENKFVYPGGEEDEEILNMKSVMTEEEFKLKICALPSKAQELVFPEFDKVKHVMDFHLTREDSNGYTLEYPEAITDPLGIRPVGWNLPLHGDVQLAIDPGYNGAYAVLACRKYDDRVFVIDEVYARQWMAQDVISECKTRSWWPDVSYAVMDIAGKQHDAMVSHLDIWAQEDALGFAPATNYVPIPDGIHKLRVWLKNPLNGRPRIFFSRNCKSTIEEFGKYRYRMAKEGRPDKEEPIDRDNHAIKAIEYFLVDRYGLGDRPRRVRSESYIKGSQNIEDYLTSGFINHRWWDS